MPKKPLYPHIPRGRQPQFPHVPGGQQPAEKLPQTKKTRTVYYAQAWVGKTLESSSPEYEVTRLDLEKAREDMKRWKQRPDVLAIEIYKGKQEFIEDAEAGRAGGYWQLAEYEDWEFVDSWQHPGTIELLASTEGDPIRKFCCRQCGECAPKELLEEGRFLDRISWLRSHYKAKHPGIWGKRLPLTKGGAGFPTIPQSAIPEPYATQYRIELRKIPTWKLEEAYKALTRGEPTSVDIVEKNRAWVLSAIREVLWERGKLREIEKPLIEDGEPVSPEYRHLASLVSEPLPKEAE